MTSAFAVRVVVDDSCNRGCGTRVARHDVVDSKGMMYA